MENNKKNYFGFFKENSYGIYGSFRRRDLEAMLSACGPSEKDAIFFNINKRKEAGKFGDTHYGVWKTPEERNKRKDTMGDFGVTEQQINDLPF